MPNIRLTARTVDTLKPPGSRVDYFDEVLPGFVLRVSEAGRKTFCVMYRSDRRLRRLTLGTYPRLTLAHARKLARKALGDVAHDKDPATEKLEARRGDTLQDLANEYLERHAKRFKKSWKEDERVINRELFPTLKHRKVKELTRRDVRELVEAIADRGAPIMANRTPGRHSENVELCGRTRMDRGEPSRADEETRC